MERHILWMFVVMMVGGCLGNSDDQAGESLIAGEDVRLEGRVLGVDATPMFVDGDGEITVRSDRYGEVLVRIPAGERVCAAQGLDVFSSVVDGDSLWISGRVTGQGEVTVCVDSTHFLRKADGS